MRFFLLLTITIFILNGCRSTDTPTDPSVNIPQSVKDLVYKSYPSAEALTPIAELEKDKVYEVSFRADQADYTVIVSKAGILSAARTAGEQVPDSLASKVQDLAIKGGEMSNYRTISFADGSTVQAADYVLNGFNYVIRFSPYATYLYTYEKEYRTQDIGDLPDGIQQYISQRHKPNPEFINSLTNLNDVSRQYIIKNNELTFSNCTVQIMPDGTRQYQVYVNYFGTTNLPILFNEKAEVIWTGFFNRIRKFDQNFDGGPAFWMPNLTSQEIAYFRDVLAGSSHFLGFNLDNFTNFEGSYRNEYEDIVGYQLQLANSGNEHWYLNYNAKKKMIFAIYSSN